MGKNKRKRRENNVELSSNVTGFNDSNAESLDDCMAEFLQPESEVATKDSSDKKNDEKEERASASSTLSLDVGAIESWNTSLISWSKSGNYPPGLLPSVDEELTRNYKVKELSSFLQSLGKEIRMPTFERWIIDAKIEENKGSSDSTKSDPILPQATTADSDASLRLIDELYRDCGISKEKATTSVAELCRKSSVFAQEMISQASMYSKQAPLKKGDKVYLEKKGDDVLTVVYSRKKWKKPFHVDINRTHYDRLKERFTEVHDKASTKLDLRASLGSKKRDGFALQAFHVSIAALLLRYSSLSGGQLLHDLRGGGMQGAIHSQVFDCLKESFDDVWMEGFASPFNAHLPNFASAFPDIEWHFGSIGNFMDSSIQSGCCEANPPFSCGLMNDMVDHIERLLSKANENERELSFVVVVPTAKGNNSAVAKAAAAESFERMTRSCRHHVLLRAREHGYVEGAQHLRPTQYKQSAYDTSVIVLQSKPAWQRPLDIEQFETRIRSAFASKHAEETEQRKKIKGGT